MGRVRGQWTTDRPKAHQWPTQNKTIRATRKGVIRAIRAWRMELEKWLDILLIYMAIVL